MFFKKKFAQYGTANPDPSRRLSIAYNNTAHNFNQILSTQIPVLKPVPEQNVAEDLKPKEPKKAQYGTSTDPSKRLSKALVDPSTEKKHFRCQLLMIIALVTLLNVGSIVAYFGVYSFLSDGETGASAAKNKEGDAFFEEVKDGVTPDGLCITKDCLEITNSIMSTARQSLHSKGVCINLYDMACGDWIDHSVLPLNHSFMSKTSHVGEKMQERLIDLLEEPGIILKGRESSAVQKLKTVYRACMDKDMTNSDDGFTYLKEIVKMLSGWTVTYKDVGWITEGWSIEKQVSDLNKYKWDGLFHITYHKPVNVTKYYIVVHSAQGTYTNTSFYEDEKAERAYMECAKVTGLLMDGVRRVVEEKMKDVWRFEKNVARITGKTYGWFEYTVRDFQKLLGNWIDIKTTIEKSVGKTISNDLVILVTKPSYFKQLGGVVKKTTNETLQNFFVWRMVMTMTPFLPGSFYFAKLEMVHIDKSQHFPQDLKQRCRDLVEEYLALALAALYEDLYFYPNAKDRIQTMVDEFKGHFIENLDELDWLDTFTRPHLREKAEAMRVIVGFPDLIRDVDQLDKIYENLKNLDEELNLRNYISLVDFKREFIFSVRRNESEYDDEVGLWSQNSPLEVNGYYLPIENTIVVPMGFLQPPFYSDGYPDSVLYGKMGMVLGHELTHGFDSKGRLIDKDGLLTNQWSDEADDAFVRASECFIKQYSSFRKHGRNESGTKTLNENIADNGGLKIAYKVFRARVENGKAKTWKLPAISMSHDQLFFISFAQFWCSKGTPAYFKEGLGTTTHAAGEFRVNGVASNSRKFSQAFNCDKHLPNTPKKRCTIW